SFFRRDNALNCVILSGLVILFTVSTSRIYTKTLWNTNLSLWERAGVRTYSSQGLGEANPQQLKHVSHPLFTKVSNRTKACLFPPPLAVNHSPLSLWERDWVRAGREGFRHRRGPGCGLFKRVFIYPKLKIPSFFTF